MQDPTFFPHSGGLSLGEIASLVDGELLGAARRETIIRGLAPLDAATPDDATFFDNQRYAELLQASEAGVVFVGEKHRKFLPEGRSALLVRSASASFALLGRSLFPSALAPLSVSTEPGLSPRAEISPAARLEEGVIVEAFAVIGADAEIGQGTIVGPGAVIGPGCRIGRDCRIGPQVTVTHSFLGNRVILHPGVRLGQDGFGYAPGAGGVTKVVQVGRVIVQDDVEIGANTTVDRGAIRDTVIGEGTKIDNQVQIAHNVRIGRFCLIASQVGIAGSVTLGNGVMVGGQAGFNGHITVGDGAEIGATASLATDMPAGARWGGTPAKPIKQWLRELTTVSDIARERRSRN